MADIILPGKIRPLASSLEPDLDALSDHERLALGKQQRLTDVIKIGRLELDADRRFGEAFEALKQDEGVSSPDFLSRADSAGDQIMREVTEAIPGEVSDGAREALLRTLGSRRNDYDLDIDALRGVARTRDGLALVEDAVARAVDIVNKEPFRLKARLDDLDRMAGDMGTALAPLREDALQDRRAAIVTAAVKGLVAQGQGEKAQLLLDSGVLDDRLGTDRLTRLKQTATSLTQVYDQDRQDAEQRTALEDSRARQAKALAATAAIRIRLQDGEAIETDIAAAETEGVLSVAQAGRLRAEATAARDRRNAISARVDRVTSMLDSGDRPDPQDPGTRDDVARHYDATVKPALAGLDPARKAAAIRGYVTETGIAPDPALDTLLALTATGDPANRIAAARQLKSVLTADPAAIGKVPPKLAEYAETAVQLADLDALAPEDIVKTAEQVFGESNMAPDGLNPALLYLAKGLEKPTGQPDEKSASTPDADTGQDDTAPGEAGSHEEPPAGEEANIHLRPDTGSNDGRLGVYDGPTLIGFASDADKVSKITDALEGGDPAKIALGPDRNTTDTPFGRVLDRIAKAAAGEFKGDIGISAETAEALRKAGILPEPGDTSLVRAFNDLLIKGGSAAADLAFRALLAIESGIVAATGQTAQELGETPTFARRLERDMAIFAMILGRYGKPLKARRSINRIARLDATPSLTPRQKKTIGDISERQRLQRLKPRNDFGGPGAYSTLSPERAFESTRFPPQSPKENAFRGLAAVDLVIKDVLAKGEGIVDKAMRRTGLPNGQEAISFRWGKPGEGIEFKGGFGLSHIIAKHGIESVEEVVETIAKGKIVKMPDDPQRLILEFRKNRAVLALIKDGKHESWVLTGFSKSIPTGFFNLRQLTGTVYFKGK